MFILYCYAGLETMIVSQSRGWVELEFRIEPSSSGWSVYTRTQRCWDQHRRFAVKLFTETIQSYYRVYNYMQQAGLKSSFSYGQSHSIGNGMRHPDTGVSFQHIILMPIQDLFLTKYDTRQEGKSQRGICLPLKVIRCNKSSVLIY